MPDALAVTGLRKSYGPVRAVRDISFTVGPRRDRRAARPERGGQDHDPGDPRGIPHRDAGQAEVLGIDPGDRAAGRELRERIGLVLQDIAVEPYLTVAETVARDAGYYPAPRDVGRGDRARRPGRPGRQKVRGAVRRAEAAAGPGPRPDRQPGTAVPGRADDRLRPGRPPRRLGAGARPAHAGHHDHAHHALTWTKPRRWPTGWC